MLLINILIILNILIFNVNAETTQITQNEENNCGMNCHWEYNTNTKTITFTKNGTIRDFYSDSEIPWKQHLKEIEEPFGKN